MTIEDLKKVFGYWHQGVRLIGATYLDYSNSRIASYEIIENLLAVFLDTWFSSHNNKTETISRPAAADIFPVAMYHVQSLINEMNQSNTLSKI